MQVSFLFFSILAASHLVGASVSALVSKEGKVGARLPSSIASSNPRYWAVPAGGASDGAVSLVETPADTYRLLASKGEAATKASVAKTLTAAIMGGAFVGVGGMVSFAVAGNLPSADPGMIKLAFGLLFPVALFLCLQAGAQLFTGNTATMTAALCEKKITLKAMLRGWVLSYVGNIIGCAGFAWLCSYTGVLSGGAASFAATATSGKCAAAFGPTLVKAILCNWLVCMAVFCATQARDVMGKYIGIVLPISSFVAIGFEHSVANMFILPAGLLAGGSGLTLAETLLKNLIPVTIGNIIAGAGIVGAGLSWQFGKLGEGK